MKVIHSPRVTLTLLVLISVNSAFAFDGNVQASHPFLCKAFDDFYDYNGDGVDDYLCGDPESDRMAIISGKNGANLRARGGGPNNGTALANIGDQNGDGKPEIATCTASGSISTPAGALTFGRVQIYDGATGNDWLGSNTGLTCSEIINVGDIEGNDDKDDFVLVRRRESPNRYELAFFRVYAGQIVQFQHMASPDNPNGENFFGRWVASYGDDLDGDGINEIITSDARYSTSQHTRAGAIYILSGADRSVIRRIVGTRNNQFMGRGVAIYQDIDGNGRNEILTASSNFGGEHYLHILSPTLFVNPQGQSTFTHYSAQVLSGVSALHSVSSALKADGNMFDVNGDNIQDFALMVNNGNSHMRVVIASPFPDASAQTGYTILRDVTGVRNLLYQSHTVVKPLARNSKRNQTANGSHAFGEIHSQYLVPDKLYRGKNYGCENIQVATQILNDDLGHRGDNLIEPTLERIPDVGCPYAQGTAAWRLSGLTPNTPSVTLMSSTALQHPIPLGANGFLHLGASRGPDHLHCANQSTEGSPTGSPLCLYVDPVPQFVTGSNGSSILIATDLAAATNGFAVGQDAVFVGQGFNLGQVNQVVPSPSGPVVVSDGLAGTDLYQWIFPAIP